MVMIVWSWIVVRGDGNAPEINTSRWDSTNPNVYFLLVIEHSPVVYSATVTEQASVLCYMTNS